MSYPGVDPTDAHETSPVGAQGASVGVKEVELPNDPVVDPQVKAQVKAEVAGNPDLQQSVKQAVEDMFAVNESAWAPKQILKFVVECPSGQKVLVKYLGTLDLLEYDLVEELDFFTRKLFPVDIDLSGNPVEAQEAAEQTIWAALRDPEKRRRFLDMTGKLMAAACVKPRVVHDGVVLVDDTDPDGNPTSEKVTRFGYQLDLSQQLEHFKKPLAPLPANGIYSGYVDFADRMTIFQELNKPLGMIEPFREESLAVLQDMARGEGSGGEAQ